ncbi:hypothetical protein FRC19_006430 [Serendipita sp. 401]|nr:hypothetical protein FRC19_006430 [Serendipita sp. 401]
MRQKRAKAYRKLMAMYELSFGFRQPYQVLVDSGMCITAQDHKIDLVKQLETVLQGKIKPMITQCCIVELYKMGKERQPAVDLAKMFERRKCNHREAIEGSECLKHVTGDTNKHRYVIATQAQELRSQLRAIQAVPLVHIKMSVMVIEPPSEETLRIKERMTQEALDISEKEKQDLVGTKPVEPSPVLKVHRKAKGPNPLSIKKKQSRPVDPTSGAASSKRPREDDKDEEEEEDEGVAPRKKKRRRRKNTEMVATGPLDVSLST